MISGCRELTHISEVDHLETSLVFGLDFWPDFLF